MCVRERVKKTACVPHFAHLEQRQAVGLSSPPEGCLPLCWGHGRRVEGGTPAVWVPAPGATSLGLQREGKVEQRRGVWGQGKQRNTQQG